MMFLMSLKVSIEHVITGGPAGFDAIGGCDPLATGLAIPQLIEVFLVESTRRGPANFETQETHPATEECHRELRWR